MNVKRIVLGSLKENCYILEKNNKLLIIDPGADFFKIEREVHKEVEAVIITHGHYDHIGALQEVIKRYGCKEYGFSDLEEKHYEFGPFSFSIIYTQGHTDDSITVYFEDEKMMFAGDFIFKNGIGRWDLPTGNFDKLKKSIEKISSYPDYVKVFTGHGDETTIGEFKMWVDS